MAGVRICIYVDDITIHATGTAQDVSSTLCRALDEELENGLAMRASRRESWMSEGHGKTALATTNVAVTRAVATSMRRLGIQVKCKASHLGVPFRLEERLAPLPWQPPIRAAPRTTRRQDRHNARSRIRSNRHLPHGGHHACNAAVHSLVSWPRSRRIHNGAPRLAIQRPTV